nr:uncharacterized protein LOC109622130 [Aedes albopictus]
MAQVTLLLLLLSLPAIFSKAIKIGDHELIETTFAYRKKPNTPEWNNCFPVLPNMKCLQSAEFCGAFHVGKNFYVTAAHCLVGVDGHIQDPNELEIVGVGKVNVTIALHHEYVHNSPNSRDVAWIKYEHPTEVPIVRVAEDMPSDCRDYRLEVFDPAAQGMSAGIRWVERQIEFVNYMPDPDTGTSTNVNVNEYRVFGNKDSADNFHVFLCIGANSEGLHEVHYMQIGRIERYLMTIDCHFVKCG